MCPIIVAPATLFGMVVYWAPAGCGFKSGCDWNLWPEINLKKIENGLKKYFVILFSFFVQEHFWGTEPIWGGKKAGKLTYPAPPPTSCQGKIWPSGALKKISGRGFQRLEIFLTFLFTSPITFHRFLCGFEAPKMIISTH